MRMNGCRCNLFTQTAAEHLFFAPCTHLLAPKIVHVVVQNGCAQLATIIDALFFLLPGWM